jgi:hypothetical protein
LQSKDQSWSWLAKDFAIFCQFFFSKTLWELNPNRVGFEGRVCHWKVLQFQGKFKKMKKKGIQCGPPLLFIFFSKILKKG